MSNHYNATGGISRDQVEIAMKYTKSNRAASIYLGVHFKTWKKYALMYYDENLGITLYEKHKSRGFGIKKGKNYNAIESEVLMDILAGKINPSSYTPERLKNRLIREGLLKEECACCGFKEQRLHDYKVPLLLVFRDGNKRNWKIDNMELLCYNHYFLNIGDVFTKRQVEQLEGVQRMINTKIEKTLQIEDEHVDAIKDVITNKERPTSPNKEVPKAEDDDGGESLLFRM